jgi:hypothetical protein
MSRAIDLLDCSLVRLNDPILGNLMPDYIADALYTLGHTPLPRKISDLNPEAVSYLQGMKAVAGKLEDRELYAFDASALRAASDLRIDTPERVDRLVSAVFSEPRSLFFEADVAERDEAMRSLRGFFGHLQGSRKPAQRFGVFVDILGGGRAIIQPVWMHKRDVWKESSSLGAMANEFRKLPTSMHRGMQHGLSLAVSPKVGLMDISRHVGMARSEFDYVLDRAKVGFDPLLDRAKNAVDNAEGVRASGRAKDDFWRMVRFRDIVATQDAKDLHLGSIGADIHRLYPSSMFDPLELGLHVIAMCAVLKADSDDIAHQPRSRASQKKPSEKHGAQIAGTKKAKGLSVVSLKIMDEGLQRFYDSGVSYDPAPGATSSARARHPVRGHLFLARNGKLTWRKPHWRGSMEGATLRRVTAPGH